jgi:hypothetical protein
MGRLHLYRNISITFIIFLLFYSQATIVITPDAQTVNLSFVTEIRPSSTPEEIAKQDAVGGTVATLSKSVEAIFDTSSTRSNASNLVGQVRIINNYSKPQKLVKTTQLQADNGVIVRTNAEVTVPAGGSVDVAVFPKDPSTFSSIESGKLVIIKLWPQLQSQIYGEVVEPLAVSGGEVRFIAESDINRAKKELVAKAISLALQEASSSNASINGELISYSIDKKLGDEAKSFTMKAIVKLKTIAANETQLAELIKRKAQKMDLNGLSATSIDMSQVKYSVMDASNPDSIIIKVTYPLKAYLTEGNDLLKKSNFTGKTAAQIREYAAKTGIIKNIEVIISPYWRDVAPKDEKRIKLIIQ